MIIILIIITSIERHSIKICANEIEIYESLSVITINIKNNNNNYTLVQKGQSKESFKAGMRRNVRSK